MESFPAWFLSLGWTDSCGSEDSCDLTLFSEWSRRLGWRRLLVTISESRLKETFVTQRLKTKPLGWWNDKKDKLKDLWAVLFCVFFFRAANCTFYLIIHEALSDRCSYTCSPQMNSVSWCVWKPINQSRSAKATDASIRCNASHLFDAVFVNVNAVEFTPRWCFVFFWRGVDWGFQNFGIPT